MGHVFPVRHAPDPGRHGDYRGDILEPHGEDLDSTTSIVRFTEPYSLRAALEKQRHGLCVGVIHSHPAELRRTAEPAR